MKINKFFQQIFIEELVTIIKFALNLTEAMNLLARANNFQIIVDACNSYWGCQISVFLETFCLGTTRFFTEKKSALKFYKIIHILQVYMSFDKSLFMALAQFNQRYLGNGAAEPIFNFFFKSPQNLILNH